MFNKVVRWHRLGEVENVYVAYIISVSKSQLYNVFCFVCFLLVFLLVFFFFLFLFFFFSLLLMYFVYDIIINKYNFSHFAIFLPKVVKIGGNLTKF